MDIIIICTAKNNRTNDLITFKILYFRKLKYYVKVVDYQINQESWVLKNGKSYLRLLLTEQSKLF
jgi:hypothetical protein